MPIRSMTGFGLAEGASASGTYRVELRGVNNRFMELQARLPKFVANLEQKIRKEITSVISRGSLQIFITCDRENEELRLTWDETTAGNYIQIFREISDKYALQGGATLSDLLHFNDIIKTENTVYDDEALWGHLQPVVVSAIVQFQASRDTEGAFIATDLKKVMDEISNSVTAIEARAPQRIELYAAVLRERIAKLVVEQPDPQRIATEIALFADRLDISEECTRMRAHIAKFRDDFELNEPVGKRLGFLLQEMNREANTIGSKANDTEVAHLSISLKEKIEKIREQIQNIE